jgi:hypothetical protein
MNGRTLARKMKVLRKEHPETLTSMNNLAGVLFQRNKYEEAEGLHRQTLAAREKVLGTRHPSTLTSIYCLAHLLAHRDFYDEAVLLYQKACTGYTTSLGYNHPTTRACHRHYSSYFRLKRLNYHPCH